MASNELPDDELIARYVDPNPWHGGPDGAKLIDSRVSIWNVISQLQIPGSSPESVANEYRLSLREVEAALAYYRSHQDLIDARILLNNAWWDEVEPADIERNYLIRSVISSLAIEGVHVSYADASRLLDEVDQEPLADIGSSG